MPDITKEIKALKEAVYGEDVRSGFVSVAEKVNEVASDMETKRDNGYFKGAKGDKGNKGDKGDPAATVTVNEVITGAPGTNAEVTNVGTVSNVKLNFKIPRGADGSSAAYQLPPATASALGGVKSGGDITVDKNGNVTLNNTAVDQVLTQLYPKGITSQIKLGSMTKQPVSGLVTFTTAEIAATHNHATSGTTGGVYWVKYEDGTCILCGSVSKNELTLNELSGTYNKNISFPFTLYGKPTPSVTAIYAQGVPIVGCINISATEITVGSKDNVDNMKISWTVTARWKA